jgi:hypothetical protein
MIKLAIYLIIIYAIIFLLKSPTIKGKFGERLVSFCLDKYLDKSKYRILNDVMISDNMGGTTQIDHIVISKYGIFVVETKNYKGWIYGDAKSRTWTQVIYRKKTKFQNPFFQHYKHILCLADSTGVPKECFYHIVFFAGDCELKTKDKMPEALFVRGSAMGNYIKSFTHECFDDLQVEAIEKRILNAQTENTFLNRHAHNSYVRNIAKKR